MSTIPHSKPETESSVLKLSGVTLGYPENIALADVSFNVERGEFIGIIGPNGSGKSTLLKGILGLLKPVAGEIKIFNAGNEYRPKIGYVPQKNKNETSFPVQVKEAVMMGLYAQLGWMRRPAKRHWQMVAESLDQVGMIDFSERPLGELSGGQFQRVMIARALVAGPELLLLDEPTAAVDISAQHDILELLGKLNREGRITIMMVSHDINEIVHFCHRILLLNGKVSAFGPPSEVLTKEKLRAVYGASVFIYKHNDHPHIMAGDFDD